MRMHVLSGSNDTFTVVVHQATPTGNNSAGFAWPAVIVAAGRATTIMTAGTAPGQTTAAERDAILAGTTLEGVFAYTDNPAHTTAQRNAELDLQATSLLSQMQARMAAELKWYGATRT